VNRKLLWAIIVLLLALPACAPATEDPSRQASGAPAPAASTAPKRLVAAIRSAPPTMVSYYNTIVPGGTYMGKLVSSGLTTANDQGVRAPQIAEAVPSTDNGLWNVLPDGRMETTWKIREGATWHDGTPIRAGDFAFTLRVQRDLPEFKTKAAAFIEGIEAPDERTVLVRWKEPYIDADALFADPPLPPHLLEEPYLQAKTTFDQLDYWRGGYVGTGPYRVREFKASEHVLLDAFDQYVLGRPRIDQIEVRFIPDVNSLTANVLAGEVQLTMGLKNFSAEESATLGDQWKDGTIAVASITTVVAYTQFVDPDPPILANIQFRRALLYALNRQELATTFARGLGMVPDSLYSPDQAEFPEVQSAAAKYDYDPRRAAQLLEGIGLTRDAEGFYRDATGYKPVVQARSNTTTTNQTVMHFAADSWKRAGIAAEPYIVPQAQSQLPEVRAPFPSFEILGQTGGKHFDTLKSCGARLSSNSFVGCGGVTNYTRFMEPRMDELLARYDTTIPWGPRMAVAREIVQWVTDQVMITGMAYTSDGNVVSNRLENVSQSVWNAHLWDMK
jgi:peptide/nickel transport system substrate-binding protein